MKHGKCLAIAALLCLSVSSCTTDADTASANLSIAADQFEISRRIVFYNGITGEYLLQIEGLCSLGNNDPENRLSVTCKTGPAEYKKHFLGLSDNMSFVCEQIEASAASPYRYRVVFKPLSVIPDIDIER